MRQIFVLENFDKMTGNNICLLQDHLVPKLFEGKYNKSLEWEDPKKQIFRIPWYREYRPGTRNWKNEYAEWCLDWDRMKGRTVEYTAKYISKSKERMRNSLRKSHWIKELAIKDGCRRYQIIGFKVNSCTPAPSNTEQDPCEGAPLSVQSVCGSDTSGYESEVHLPMNEQETCEEAELPESVAKLNKSINPFPICNGMEPGSSNLQVSSPSVDSVDSLESNENMQLSNNEKIDIPCTSPSICQFSTWNTFECTSDLGMNASSQLSFAASEAFQSQLYSEMATSQRWEESQNINQGVVQNVPQVSDIAMIQLTEYNRNIESAYLSSSLCPGANQMQQNFYVPAVAGENSQQAYAPTFTDNPLEGLEQGCHLDIDMEFLFSQNDQTVENTVFQDVLIMEEEEMSYPNR